jgi:transposase
MSLTKCYVDSTGYSPDFNREYRKIEEKLALLQRWLSRKTKGSRNYEKMRVKIARLHERAANIRRELQERESFRLIKEDLTLRDRKWTCPGCGAEHDRDENAARNLREYRRRVLLQWQELTPMDREALARTGPSETDLVRPRKWKEVGKVASNNRDKP